MRPYQSGGCLFQVEQRNCSRVVLAQQAAVVAVGVGLYVEAGVHVSPPLASVLAS